MVRNLIITVFLFFAFQIGELLAQDTTGKAISEAAFSNKMKKRKSIVLDVRTPEEFSEGHIKNARNYNVLDSLSFEQQISKLKKNKQYLLYCKSGKRSGKALVLMQQKGFKHLYHLDGGITAWTGEKVKPAVQ